MVRKNPRKAETVIFHINCEKCIGMTAIFVVLLTIFILQSDAMGKLSFNVSAFCEIVDKTSATVKVEETDVEISETLEEDIVEEITTKSEDIQENNIIERQRFMALAPNNLVNYTVNLASFNSESYIYTSSRSIDEIIAEIGPQMDISGTSGISKEDFIFAMQNCEGDTTGNMGLIAGDIWDACQEPNVNEFAIAGKVALECGWANPEKSELVAKKNNLMSIKDNNGNYKEYDSFSECIQDGVRLITEEYISIDGRYKTGGNLTEIGKVYCPDTPEWPIQVANCARMIAETLIIEEEED